MKSGHTPPLPNKKYSIIYADPPWKVKASYITGASGVKSHVSEPRLCRLKVIQRYSNRCRRFCLTIEYLLCYNIFSNFMKNPSTKLLIAEAFSTSNKGIKNGHSKRTFQ